jgi:hypothetical protein
MPATAIIHEQHLLKYLSIEANPLLYMRKTLFLKSEQNRRYLMDSGTKGGLKNQ